MNETIERKYVLTKIAPGDYLLPSNDAQTIWRIRVYEDGPSHGIEDWPSDITLWGVWRWTGRREMVDLEDWDKWRWEAEGLDTRKEAIHVALSIKT